MRPTILILCALTLATAVPASAQTNLGVTGGMLLPVGDFGDVADPSPYVGARWEIQDVNVLGQVAALSVLVHGGFAFLQTDSELEEALDAIGDSDDGSYFDLGVGVRAHSTASPLFLGVGVSFINLDVAGSADSENGFGAHIGLGVSFTQAAFQFDIEGRANVGLLEGDDDVTFFQVLANFGLPF